jgi:imidazole glycerol-phosphate synthase subunit HisH
VGSILNMLKRIGVKSCVSRDPETIRSAAQLILPGVGAFDNGMRQLKELDLIGLLAETVHERKVPLLGICLGYQLMTESSEEGVLDGLGWLQARTKRFSFNQEQSDFRVPHMGWNEVSTVRDTPLLSSLSDGPPRFYFAHSYYVECARDTDVYLRCNYGIDFHAAAGAGNIFGVQFHPEKSHRFGMALLRNFTSLKDPAC